MQRLPDHVFAGLAAHDTPTVFNAMVTRFGLPNEEYTDHTIRCLLPELGSVIGYAATVEVTTNDPDSPAASWRDHYRHLEEAAGPHVVVMRDVDSRPGRGASFGDVMAVMHKRLGVAGVVVDGTIRDLDGIRDVGLPMFAWGVVPGHGVFCPVRLGAPITVGQLRIRPGDLVMADSNGCLRVPVDRAEETLAAVQSVIDLEDGKRRFAESAEFTAAEAARRFGWQ
ncbi:MAG: RraA family protein [Spirochaetaceae bacterium]|nr:RraA family protein [Spirochaetaceae bacterium]